MCGNIACAVTTLDDEKDVPKVWRAEELSKIEGPRARHPGRKEQRERGIERPLQGTLGDNVGESCVVEYDDDCDDRDYCVPEDESATARGDYVSLLDNPEKFTGYSGHGAHMVWDAIYQENCFSKPVEDSSTVQPASQLFQATNDLRNVLQAAELEEVTTDDTCLEKRVFYRIISGMHASISTHLCYDYLDQTTGKWGPNMTCYQERLAEYPDRISNIYFNYALVLRAIAKLKPCLTDYTFCSGDFNQNRDTKSKLFDLVDKAANAPPIFDESLMFQDPASGIELKEDFRQRFRNVSRLMDCVGCDKCRLWGKLQTAGYGTALKVLFELDDDTANFHLKRTELVSLINTLGRISDSISALTYFRGPQQKSSTTGSSPADHFPTSHPRKIPADPSKSDDDDDEWESPSTCAHCNPSSNETDPTFYGIFMDEFDFVWRTFKYILAEWWGLPGKFARLFVLEFGRLWHQFIGLPGPAPYVQYEMSRPPLRRERHGEL